MRTNIKFTIAIPAYKKEFLRQCITSILSQSYPDFEVLIIDDCSPENLKSIVEEFHDSRLHYERNSKNCGSYNVVENWNKCLDRAKGDFIICLGDDDMLPSKSLEMYVEKIQKYPDVDAFHARTLLIDPKDHPYYITSLRSERQSMLDFMRSRFDGELEFIGDFCYRTNKLKDIGGYYWLPLAWGADDMTAYMMSKDKGIVNLAEPSFCYRTNPYSISSTGNLVSKAEAVREQQSAIKKMLNEVTVNSMADQLTLDFLKDKIASNFDRNISGYISEDIKKSFFNLFNWLKNRDKLSLNKKVVLKALAYYIK